MKNIYRFLGMILLFLSVFSCKEDKPTPPVVATIVVSEITATSAKSGGTISADGGAPITASGVCWSTSNEPTTSDSKTVDVLTAGSFASTITNLEGGKLYYTRAYATNSAGTSYGIAMSFTTLGQAPVSSVSKATNISSTSATINGTVNANYLSTVVTFEYGVTTSYGNSKEAKQSPVTGNTDLAVSTELTELLPGTVYHFRLKTANSIGATYSTDLQFITGLSDLDGNEYKAVAIGTQIWMAENLMTTKYTDGTAIQNVIDNTAWTNLTTGAYSWYENDKETYGTTYGALYNGYCVTSGKLCPVGWHVPNNFEWDKLIDLFGGKDVAGDKLKEAGNSHWISPSTSASNESGFTGLPGGLRYNDLGIFNSIGVFGIWWSSSEDNTDLWYIYLANNSPKARRYTTLKGEGYSLRCIKD